MSTLWIPGAAGPLEQFVDRLQRRIADYAQRHGLEQVAVEVQLVDGALFAVKDISAEPGFGFVTLIPFDEPEEELIVPSAQFAASPSARPRRRWRGSGSRRRRRSRDATSSAITSNQM